MLVRCAVALSAGRNEGSPLPSRALSKAKIRSRINMTPIKTVVVGQEKKVEAVSLLRNASREWLGDWTSRKLQGMRKVIPSAKITESAKRCLQLQMALGLLGTTVLATGPGRSRSRRAGGLLVEAQLISLIFQPQRTRYKTHSRAGTGRFTES